MDLTTKILYFKIELKKSFSTIEMMETKYNGKNQTLTLKNIPMNVVWTKEGHYIPRVHYIHQGSRSKYQVYHILIFFKNYVILS